MNLCVRLRLIAAASLLLMTLLSCSQVPVVLWTDVAGVAPMAEAFNAAQAERVVEVEVVADIPTELRLTQQQPDLVIASYIEDALTAQFFQPLDGLLRRDVGRDVFYADLLEAGRRNGRQLLIPVSFNLPLLYFPEPVRPAGAPRIIDEQTIRARSEQFNQGTGERWTSLGFSPVWNRAFLYQYLRANGFSVTESEQGTPQWDPDVVALTLERVERWITQANGSLALDAAFTERYLYAPPLQLVKSGRVGYGFTTSDQFFSLTDQQRADLGFRWYGEADRIIALEEMVFAAVPQEARNVAGALEFLAFLFDAENQRIIVQQTLRKQEDAFGLAGGFSSLWRVTEQWFAQYYPELAGMVPARTSLVFSGPSPRHWGSIIEEVVQPWLLREATGAPQSRDLEGAVRAWLLQQEQ